MSSGITLSASLAGYVDGIPDSVILRFGEVLAVHLSADMAEELGVMLLNLADEIEEVTTGAATMWFPVNTGVN